MYERPLLQDATRQDTSPQDWQAWAQWFQTEQGPCYSTRVYKPDGKSQIVFTTKPDTQRNIFTLTFISAHASMSVHLLVHIFSTFIWKKHALFLADEYHQSNMAVTFCAILKKDYIFHSNAEVRFMYKSTNDEYLLN